MNINQFRHYLTESSDAAKTAKNIADHLQKITNKPDWYADRKALNDLTDLAQDELPGSNLRDATNKTDVGAKLRKLGEMGKGATANQVQKMVQDIMDVLGRF